MDAEDCFAEALQVEPGSVKAQVSSPHPHHSPPILPTPLPCLSPAFRCCLQGNLGNALLARGQLKLQLIGTTPPLPPLTPALPSRPATDSYMPTTAAESPSMPCPPLAPPPFPPLPPRCPPLPPRAAEGTAADSDDAEAEALLVEAGRCFRTVLEADARDERALCNWAAALCARAELVLPFSPPPPPFPRELRCGCHE